MRWIDGHLDLAYLALQRDLRVEIDDPNAGCVSLPALREAGVELCLATIFTEPGVGGPQHLHGYPSSDDLDAAEAAGLRQLAIYEQWEAEGEISIVRSASDLEGRGPALKVVILMEGADPIRSPDQVSRWFARGLRVVGLAWAAGTRYAGGNSRPPAPGRSPETAHGSTAGSTLGSQPSRGQTRWDACGGGLSSAGIELVGALDEAGIIHDASHLSDAAFDGLLEHAQGPIVASHSNCRALVEPWQRHLRDDQIKTIGDRGG